MKKYGLILLQIMLCLSACTQQSNEEKFLENNKGFKETFESKIKGVYENYKLQGDLLFAVVDENGLAYSYALNKDILAGNPSSLNNDSPIYIGSHTKAFTGTLMKILEEDGLVDLDKTLHDYLPELTFDGSIPTNSITLKKALNHTSGLMSIMAAYKTVGLGVTGGYKELVETFNSDFRYDPSGNYRYSNFGPILGGMVIDKVTGSTWQEESKKRIFEPLGMANTSSKVTDFNFDDIRPSIQVSRDTIYKKGFSKRNSTMHAAGGTISTINDLAKWVKFNINQETSILKNKSSFDDLHKPATKQDRTYFNYKRDGYSIGWDLATLQGDRILTRFGSLDGIQFHLSFIPSKKIGVIAFSSEDRAWLLHHLSANYAYNLLGKNPKTEEIFKEEEKMFSERYEQTNNRPIPPSINSLPKLEQSEDNDKLIGVYKNELGWSDIKIEKSNSKYYKISWGTLTETIHVDSEESEQPYTFDIGIGFRNFSVEGDNLLTGSIRYKKVK